MVRDCDVSGDDEDGNESRNNSRLEKRLECAEAGAEHLQGATLYRQEFRVKTHCS